MRVRILPAAKNYGKGVKVERCRQHVFVTGEVTESRKVNGVLERTRRCSQCGGLFKTFEMTEDQMAKAKRERDFKLEDLRRERDFYKEGIDLVKRVWEDEDYLKEYLQYEYRFRINKGEDVDAKTV